MLIELDTVDLILTLVLILVALALSRWQQLGLEGQLFLSAGRAFLQLVAVGYVLELIFTLETVWGVFGVLLVMITVATTVTQNRISQKLSHRFWLVGGSLVLTTAVTLGYVMLFIVQPSTWYDPQYWIPLAGIIIGNAVNGGTIAGERLVNAMETNRGEIETHLCLGASP